MTNPTKKYYFRSIEHFVLTGVLILSGCSLPQRTHTIKIGLALYDAHDTFISEFSTHFNDNIKESSEDVQLESYDASGSQYTQNTQVAQLIDNGCDVLCINPVDRTAPGKMIELARENNIPIIFFNREPVEEDLKQWNRIYYIGSSAKGSGTLQGEAAADYLKTHPDADRNRDGVIQYILLEGEPGHQDSIMRSEESVETLEEKGYVLEKTDYAIANWSRQQAQTKITQMLDKHIELILSNNDDMAAGAVSAYEQAGIPRTERPVIIGFDGTSVGLELMKNEQMAGTVYNNSNIQADMMFQLASTLARNEPLTDFHLEKDRRIYIPYRKITPDVLDDFLQEHDHPAEDPSSFNSYIHPTRQ